MAASLAAGFGIDAQAAASSDPAGFDLVISASPPGLKADDPPPFAPFDMARLNANARVVDILMKHATTPLTRACAARGIPAHPGFEMMVQQAPKYLAFFGFPQIANAVQADPSAVRALFTPR